MLAAAVGLLALAGSAGATHLNADPQTTNVPYVAWVGSQIRVVKCLSDTEFATHGSNLIGKFFLEGWTGANSSVVNAPSFENGVGSGQSQDITPRMEGYSVAPGQEASRLCFAANLTSYGAGLARIKLAVRETTTNPAGGDVVLKHQFLAIFMTATTPTLTEEDRLGVGDPGGSGIFNPGNFDGKPGNEWAPGLVKAAVKGTFPYGDQAAVNGLPAGPATITLPDDWAALAGIFAVDKDPYQGGVYGSEPMRWDIHDGTTVTTPDQHTSNACAIPGSTIDAVDNCLGATLTDPDLGPFSRDNTNHSNLGMEVAAPAIGPFDPLRPSSTFLPDGQLNAGDAPMPALRVDVKLGAGSIGALIKADKSKVFSLDGTGAGTAHNLYAPFYKAYVPAFLPGDSGQSGVAGATVANNFPGFGLGQFRPYDYWDLLLTQSRTDPNPQCNNPLGQQYQGARGVNSVTVYTDEHGEAWVGFDPVPGNNTLTGAFNLTPTASGINSVCDLSPGVAGTATITATGFYPEQPGSAIAFPAPLTKTVNHAASKLLECAKKVGTDGKPFPGSTCTETILDLAGNPIAGAEVLFQISNAAGGTIQPDTTEKSVRDLEGLHVWTDAAGKATIYVTNSDDNCVDIRAENVGTRWRASSVGVERTFKIRPTSGTPCGTTTPPPAGTVAPGSSAPAPAAPAASAPAPAPAASTAAAGSSVTVSLGGPVIKASPVLQVSTKPQLVASNAAKLFSLRVLQTKFGRYLVVNVKGKATTKAKVRFVVVGKNGKVLKTVVRTVPAVKVRIAIVGKNGKVMRTIVRWVPVNKAFRLANFTLAKTAMSVRASVLAA